jgi:hypothetical protein
VPPGCGGGGARGRRHWPVGAGNGHSASSRAAPFSGVVGNDGVVRLVVAVSTLLGPEGTTLGRPCAGARGLRMTRGLRVVVFQVWWLPGMAWGAHRLRPCVGVVLGVSRGVVGWLWVENCIVDASILFSVVFCVCG